MGGGAKALLYVAIGAIGGAFSALTFYRSFHRRKDESKNEAASRDVITCDKSIDYPAEIKDELFSRVRAFFGEAEYSNLEHSFVIVVGLGGVGSHAANMLVRSGVRRIRLIDFDQVTLSSLNRHAVATMEDVGLSKAEVMRNKLLKVVPWCTIEAETEMFKKENAFRLLDGNPSIVLDCIDDVSTKAELIAHCMKNHIKVVRDQDTHQNRTLSSSLRNPIAIDDSSIFVFQFLVIGGKMQNHSTSIVSSKYFELNIPFSFVHFNIEGADVDGCWW